MRWVLKLLKSMHCKPHIMMKFFINYEVVFPKLELFSCVHVLLVWKVIWEHDLRNYLSCYEPHCPKNIMDCYCFINEWEGFFLDLQIKCSYFLIKNLHVIDQKDDHRIINYWKGSSLHKFSCVLKQELPHIMFKYFGWLLTCFWIKKGQDNKRHGKDRLIILGPITWLKGRTLWLNIYLLIWCLLIH